MDHLIQAGKPETTPNKIATNNETRFLVAVNTVIPTWLHKQL
jgi:hypothetical protein